MNRDSCCLSVFYCSLIATGKGAIDMYAELEKAHKMKIKLWHSLSAIDKCPPFYDITNDNDKTMRGKVISVSCLLLLIKSFNKNVFFSDIHFFYSSTH